MSSAGDVIENPVTGERVVVRVGTEGSGGELLAIDGYSKPGGAVTGEHVHPAIEEHFTVVRGGELASASTVASGSHGPESASTCRPARRTTGGTPGRKLTSWSRSGPAPDSRKWPSTSSARHGKARRTREACPTCCRPRSSSGRSATCWSSPGLY